VTKTSATYGQLDRVLRGLGFSCRPAHQPPPGKVYEHKASGAVIVLPLYPDDDRVRERHWITVRTTLDGFGIADFDVFDGKFQRAG
jgi:hypothetical protein